MEEKHVTSRDGTKIFYKISRKKSPALVFIHGIGCNHTVWKDYLKHFSKKYTVIAPDLRGHGKSGLGDITITNFAKDIKTILTNEKITNFIIIGHCLGTNIAVRLNEMVHAKKMVLMGIYFPDVVRHRWLYKPLSKLYLLLNPVLKWIPARKKYQDYTEHRTKPSWLFPLIDLRGTTLEAYAKTMLAIYDYYPNIVNIKIPTLVIEGDNDSLVHMRRIRRMCDKFRFEMLDYADHLTSIKDPEASIKLIEQFIKK